MAASTRLGLVFKCCQVFQPSPITCDQSNSRHDKHFHVLQEGHACTKTGMIVVGVSSNMRPRSSRFTPRRLIGQIPILALPPGGLPGIPLGMTLHNNLKKSATASIYQFMSEVLL
ncbi:hypothetical protein VitviT2T_023692 [Vitis vinifera]|uniref:Uncharacterized protein n=1 Tax=Vitis vinifera TaxID=29760 RepID=A0ABY9DG86_VITVI|nr:hypothetical protein VitviT2T_023692 [Vitis vinifera]